MGAQITSHALYMAASSGRNEVVEYLLKNDADPRDRSDPIEAACEKCNTQTIVSLVEAVQATESMYSCALDVAVDQGDVDVVRYLVSKGAKIKTKHLTQALKRDHIDLLQFLKRQGANLPKDSALLFTAVYDGNLEGTRLLLQKDGGVNAEGPEHSTLLQAAISTRNAAMVSLLLEYHADPDGKEYSYSSPLEDAVKIGDSTIVRILVAKGAEINGARYGTPAKSPLRIAVEHDDLAIVRILVQNDAEVNPWGGDKWCALEEAVKKG